MEKAIVFTSKDVVEIKDYTPPPLGAGEILVRTEYSGVSQGTEIWALIGRRPELEFPTIPGYQAVGKIEQIGADAGAAGFKVGQRVLFHTSRLSAEWPETWMGAHVGLAVVPVASDPPPRVVPDNIAPEAAALAALASVALRGNDMLDIRAGDFCVVMGLGMIGQGAAQFARARGAIVVATDLSETRRAFAAKHSADYVVDPRATDLGAFVKSMKPNGADVVIDTTGRSAAFMEAMALLRWEGQFLMQGYYPDPVEFDFHAAHMKKPTVRITCGCGDTARILDLMRHGRLDWAPFVTDLHPVSDAPAVYAKMARGDQSVMGAVFDWTQNAKGGAA